MLRFAKKLVVNIKAALADSCCTTNLPLIGVVFDNKASYLGSHYITQCQIQELLGWYLAANNPPLQLCDIVNLICIWLGTTEWWQISFSIGLSNDPITHDLQSKVIIIMQWEQWLCDYTNCKVCIARWEASECNVMRCEEKCSLQARLNAQNYGILLMSIKLMLLCQDALFLETDLLLNVGHKYV
jgi:hypothetical protein